MEDTSRARFERFRQALLHVVSGGDLTMDQIAQLRGIASLGRIHWTAATAYVQRDTLELLHRILASITADGVITAEEERHFNDVRHAFDIPNNLAQPLLDRLARVKVLGPIRAGRLPTVHPAHILGSDEICHLDIGAAYLKRATNRVIETPGRLLATSKRLYWIAPTGGAQHAWSAVMGVRISEFGLLVLELAKKGGSGTYSVPDVEIAEAILSTIVRMEKRQVFQGSDAADDRHSPRCQACRMATRSRKMRQMRSRREGRMARIRSHHSTQQRGREHRG